MAPSTSTVNVATLFARRQAARVALRAMVLLKVVTNAVDSAPSANRSRSRFGMRNAAVKASIAPPPPNSAAQTCSRASPSSRLHMTARPMIPAALVLRRSVRTSGAVTSSATTEGPDCGFGLELMKNADQRSRLVYRVRRGTFSLALEHCGCRASLKN